VRAPWVWYVCCCLYAPCVSIRRSVVESLFADSVPTGGRVRDYTGKRVCELVGQMASPLLQVCIFSSSAVDDAWTPENLTMLMSIGIAGTAAGSLVQCCMDQNTALGRQSEAVQAQALTGETPNGAGGPAIELRKPGHDPLVPDAPDAPQPPSPARSELERRALQIRWTILVYDVVRVCFGGLAVKFYGLFFTEVFGVRPLAFMWLQALTKLAMLTFTKLGSYLSGKGVPRTKVCFAFQVLCNIGNFTVGYGDGFGPDAVGWVLREGALNGGFHLKQTILMDHTPKVNRGMWNSIDSLNSSFWSGSALVGGWLVQKYGYQTNFAVMAWGFMLALLAWMNMLRIAHRI